MVFLPKQHNKPNVIQETGIMYVETPDGRAKRSENELRSMLERKYAYAFATGGAGAIHWIWNTNFYMDNANESHIGALRADGTEKPEADVSYDFGRFMAEIRDLFKERGARRHCRCFPLFERFLQPETGVRCHHAHDSRAVIRDEVPFRAASEYHLDVLWSATAKLILLPSAHNLDEQAWLKLIDIVKRTGATLLLQVRLVLDAYWKQTARLTDVAGRSRASQCAPGRNACAGRHLLQVSYSRRRIAEMSKEVRTWSRFEPLEAAVGIVLSSFRLDNGD